MLHRELDAGLEDEDKYCEQIRAAASLPPDDTSTHLARAPAAAGVL